MKKIFFLFLFSLLLTACSPQNLDKKQGVLSGESDHYIIYVYDSEEPLQLDKSLLLDEEENPVSREDIFLGLPVEVYYKDGVVQKAHADMKTWGNLQPTGLPNGFLHRSCVYYDGNVFWNDGFMISPAPKDLEEAFSIQVNSGTDMPEQTGEACHVEINTKILRSPSYPDALFTVEGENIRVFRKDSN